MIGTVALQAVGAATGNMVAMHVIGLPDPLMGG